MGHIGIIAEYNPFHNGHLYQLTQAKQQFPEKKIIAVMSGDFVQRGEPAVFNKYLRTECALVSGVDLLFELPPLFAIASAEHFASAAVLALSNTGIVDTLCFGAEHDDLDLFYELAKILLDEPVAYQNNLKEYLKAGQSFPKARSLALEALMPNRNLDEFLKSPNNILGLEYIKAILKYDLSLQPHIIKRAYSEYHSTSIEQSICSATALRTHIKQMGLTDAITKNIPPKGFDSIQNSSFGQPMFPDHFYSLLQYSIWDKKDHLEHYAEVSDEFANTLRNVSHFPDNYANFVDMLSSRNYTKSRVRHSLLNILLSITKESILQAKQEDYINYLRVLGFQRNASTLLKEMKETATVPVINKTATYSNQLNSKEQKQFEFDLRISSLYQQVYEQTYHKTLANEYEHSVIIKNDNHIL